MNVLRTICFMMLVSNGIIYAGVVPVKQVIKQTVSAQIVSSHTKIHAWKTTLTSEQVAFLSPLLETYADLYQQYRSDTTNKDKQSLVLDAAQAIEHVMQNWDSFYKQTVAAQMFDQLVQEWKAMNAAKLPAVRKKLASYQKAYQAYDAQPTNSNLYQKLLGQQQVVKSFMV